MDWAFLGLFLGPTRFLPSFNAVYLVLFGFTRLRHDCWSIFGFNLIFRKFFTVFLGFVGFYRVLLGFTGFYWVLLGFTGFYWV